MNSQTVIGIYLRFRNGSLAKIIYPSGSQKSARPKCQNTCKRVEKPVKKKDCHFERELKNKENEL